MIRKIKDSIAYFLVELSFKIPVDDDIYDELSFKNASLWNKFKSELSWQLYHNGCWFYG